MPCSSVFDEVTVGKFYASELIQEQYRKYHRRKKKHMEQTLSDLEAENAFKLQVTNLETINNDEWKISKY